MYLHSVAIKNVRSIDQFQLEFDHQKWAGWHVIIGDNGSGKSTLIRAIALALTGPDEAPALRLDWNDWLRGNQKEGRIELNIEPDTDCDGTTSKGAPLKKYYVPAGLKFSRDPGSGAVSLAGAKYEVNPYHYVWGTGKGWFSAAYGPFRRFAGGDQSFEKLFYSHPKLARHLSAFGEDVALTECLEWLKLLHVKKLEQSPEGNMLDDVKSFINSGGLLPHDTQLEQVSSEGVVFCDGNGQLVKVDQLSDGYRSILSMTFELIRQLVVVYGQPAVFEKIRRGEMVIDLPGVVLIDEIDAHLHPTWQRRIGLWFRQYFPKLQFIVTTHSPLVCQSADQGTVWRLAKPGDDQRSFGRITGRELEQLLYGDILDAYGTELFGTDIGRSEAGQKRLRRLAELNQKSRTSRLNASEKQELNDLRACLPTAGAGVMGG